MRVAETDINELTVGLPVASANGIPFDVFPDGIPSARQLQQNFSKNSRAQIGNWLRPVHEEAPTHTNVGDGGRLGILRGKATAER